MSINNTQRNVLLAVSRGHGVRSAIAKAMDLTPATVSTALNVLKSNGLISPTENGYEVTADAAEHIGNGRKARTGTKMEQARAVFTKFAEKGRPYVLRKFREVVGLSDAAASTYYQSLNHAHAVAQVAAKPAPKRASRKQVAA